MNAGFDLDDLCVRMTVATMAPLLRKAYYGLFRFAYTGNLEPIKDMVDMMGIRDGDDENVLGVTNEDGMCALHFAAAGGKKNVIQYLIEVGNVDINVKDTIAGETPLHHAIAKGRFPMAKFLLQNGANPNAKTKRGRTALHYAIEQGSKELVQLLISKGADVNAVAVGLGTPLQYAAGRGKGDHVELLLKHRANPNVISHDLFSPLLASIRGKSLECMDLLIKAGADLNFCGSKGMTPLGYAASEGLKEFVRCLLTAGADPNFVNDLGMKPVENAALSYKRGLVRILFPLTSPIPAIPEWSISGLFKQVHSVHAKVEREHKLKEQFLVSNSKGNECFYQKDYFGAMQWYTQALATTPDDASILSQRSQCWAKMNEGGLALEDADACIMLRPKWSVAYHLAGAARMLLKDYKMAASAFCDGLKLDPENAVLKNALREAIEARKRQQVFEF